MKINKVLLSIPPTSSFFPGICRALDYIGINYKNFDHRHFNLSEKIILGGLQNRGWAVRLLNQRLINFSKVYKPDVLFVVKAEMILPETVDILKRIGVITVNWFPDYVNAFDKALVLADHYDYLLHFDPLMVKKLTKKNKRNVCYLPFAADILPSDNQIIQQKIYKLSMIGSYFPEREKFLQKVSDLGLNIWGDTKWQNSSIKSNYRGKLPFSQVNKILQETEIGLNIQNDVPCDGAVLRVYEVMGSGTFLLSEYKIDLEKLFDLNKDLVTFSTPGQLYEQTVRFQKDPLLRNKIARRGYETVKKEHTYVHRLKSVFTLMSST